tara:strand:- start:12738 stop:12950 length:213 start_codon:yes stop_codon:yes gene_type:complete
MMNDVNDKLEQIVNDAMGRQLRGEKKQPNNEYQNIKQYTELTGKRFRMTKEQKTRNLTRDQAFDEFVGRA